MQDFESTRKAFEAYWKSEFIVERADDGRYYDSTVSTGWKHWCRALEWAGRQGEVSETQKKTIPA